MTNGNCSKITTTPHALSSKIKSKQNLTTMDPLRTSLEILRVIQQALLLILAFQIMPLPIQLQQGVLLQEAALCRDL